MSTAFWLVRRRLAHHACVSLSKQQLQEVSSEATCPDLLRCAARGLGQCACGWVDKHL
jgi:hypothetical protein